MNMVSDLCHCSLYTWNLSLELNLNKIRWSFIRKIVNKKNWLTKHFVSIFKIDKIKILGPDKCVATFKLTFIN